MNIKTVAATQTSNRPACKPRENKIQPDIVEAVARDGDDIIQLGAINVEGGRAARATINRDGSIIPIRLRSGEHRSHHVENIYASLPVEDQRCAIGKHEEEIVSATAVDGHRGVGREHVVNIRTAGTIDRGGNSGIQHVHRVIARLGVKRHTLNSRMAHRLRTKSN